MAKGDSKAKPTGTEDWSVGPIPVNDIDIGEQMLRSDPDSEDIIELAADIARRGLLQAIGVSRSGHRYQLRWGSRRLAAHRRLRRPTIMARIVEPGDVSEIVGTAAVENLLRKNLSLEEELHAVRRLTAEGRSPAEISDLCSKSRAWVDRRLALDGLAADLRDAVVSGDLPISHAETIALLDDPGARAYLLAHTLQHRPTLYHLRALAETFKATPTIGAAVEAGAQVAERQAEAPALHLPCACCRDLVPLDQLAVIRTCGSCTQIIQRGGAIDGAVADA